MREARRAVEETLASGVERYRREDFLLRFRRLAPETIAAESREASRLILRELERALRAERARAGHWSYDLDRHLGLLTAYRAEKVRLAQIVRSEGRHRGLVAARFESI